MENIDMEKEYMTKNEIKKAFQDADFKKMWMQMHTPWLRKNKKVRRNEVCPFCNSGLKYKQCECYEHRKDYILDVKHTKGWR